MSVAKHPAANGISFSFEDNAKRRARDKLIDEWIEENPEFFLHLKKLSKDELIHRLARVEVGFAYDRVIAKSPKKRGRPKKVLVPQITKQLTQPSSSRHLNLGERKIKWTKDKQLFFICVVESTKLKYGLTKDSDALRKVAARINRGARQGVILKAAKRLATALTRARKSICGKKDYDEHIKLLAKKWSKEEST